MDFLKGTSKTVMTCYNLLDVAVAGRITDFTEGKYNGDPKKSYELAQDHQAQYLLNEARCGSRSEVLDIGCGYGRILETANRFGAKKTIGITISPQQAVRCRKKGLDVRLMNYRNIPQEWNNNFSAVIANGSVEHFVQVKDANEERTDRIYEEMFNIVHRILKKNGRFVTTVIHDNTGLNPTDLMKGSVAYNRGSTNFHFARILKEDLGGWYPKRGQLEKCTQGLFTLENSEEATQDYHFTSEAWLQAIKQSVKKDPKVWQAIAGKIIRHGWRAISMLDTWAIAQSWEWQFRQNAEGKTPTLLYRDTWKRVD